MEKKELMKASVVPKYGTEDSITIQEVEKPEVKANEILINVHYAPVTPTDLTSTKKDSFIFKVFSSLIRPKKGIYGEMYVGRVVEVGNDVNDFTVGDFVYGSNGMKLGTYAEYVVVKDKTVIRKIPKGIDPLNIIALLDGGITSLPYLSEKGEIKEGQSILIIGASGSVGSMGIQIAKHFGAVVTGVCSTNNLELVKDLGCDYTIDYTTTDYTKSTKTYDIVFDAVGKSSFKQCKNILTKQGRYMTTVPSPSAMFKAIFKFKQPHKKELFAATGLRKPHLKHKDLTYLENLLVNKELTPFIEKVYDISQMTEAQKHVRSGHKKGNVIVDLTSLQRVYN